MDTAAGPTKLPLNTEAAAFVSCNSCNDKKDRSVVSVSTVDFNLFPIWRVKHVSMKLWGVDGAAKEFVQKTKDLSSLSSSARAVAEEMRKVSVKRHFLQLLRVSLAKVDLVERSRLVLMIPAHPFYELSEHGRMVKSCLTFNC